MRDKTMLPTMKCPDCEGSGQAGTRHYHEVGEVCRCRDTCSRCSGVGRVLAPEGLLLAIFQKLEALGG